MDAPIQQRMQSAHSPSKVENIARTAGCLLLLFVTVQHCLIVYSPDLYFSIDSKLSSIPIEGVGPAGSLILDALVLLAMFLGLLAERLAGRPLNRLAIILAWLPLPWLIWQGWHGHGNLGDVAVGSQWFAAVVGGIAALHLGRDPRWRLMMLCTLMALVVPLVIKGAVQVFIEHRETVNYYQENRDAILASLGIQPGTNAAISYERRLFQAEATGWFALSNVYGTILAALTTFWLTLSLCSIRRKLESGTSGLIVVITLAALLGLVLSFSKGAYGAGLIGIALAVCVLTPRQWRSLLFQWSFPATCALIILACLATIFRGAVLGEHMEGIDGYSLLFRWFYWEGAAKIIAHHPFAGVGPDGFQNAYMSVRPPTATEVVSSPHNVFLTWYSCLGVVAGTSWTVLVFYLLWRVAGPLKAISRRLRDRSTFGSYNDEVEQQPQQEQEQQPLHHNPDAKGSPFATATLPGHGLDVVVDDDQWSRRRLILTLIAALVPGFIAAWGLNIDAFTIDYNIIFMPLSIIVAILAAYALWTTAWLIPSVQLRWGVWAALTVILVHSQIEMTMNTAGSTLFVFALLGLAASAITHSASDPTRQRAAAHRLSPLADSALAVLALVLVIADLAFAVIPVARLQSLQHQAAAEMEHVGDVRDVIAELRKAATAQDWITVLDASGSTLAQEPKVNLNVDGIERDMTAAMKAGDIERLRTIMSDTTNLLIDRVMQVEIDRIGSALPLLSRAIDMQPFDFAAAKEASRLWGALAQHQMRLGDAKAADNALAKSLAIAEHARNLGRGEVEITAFLADRTADNAGRTPTADQLGKAITLQQRAVDEDPHGLNRLTELADWLDQLLKIESADHTFSVQDRADLKERTLKTYERVLSVNQDMHLDPVAAQLPDDKRQAIEKRIAELKGHGG